MTPEVSVIMNCHNSARYLPEALLSLREQTFQNFEIIFLDNCSNDASAQIAQAFGPQLLYFYNDTLVPLGAARNLAIARARAPYIAFLDCDDIWLPAKLEKQLRLVRANPALGLVCTDTEIFDRHGAHGTFFGLEEPPRGNVFADLMRRQWISMSSALVSRKALDASRDPLCPQLWFDESLHVCEEADVFYRIAHDFELDHVPEPLTRWRRHDSSSTFRKFGQFADETMAILQKHRRIYKNFDIEYADMAALLSKRANFQKAVSMWRNGQNQAARELVWPFRKESLKYRLFWLAAWLPGILFDAAARFYFSLPANWRR